MSEKFVPADLLNYVSVVHISASNDIAACVVQQADPAIDENSSRIWLVPLDGNRPRVFTTGTDSVPAWSPDGRSLAFVSNRDDAGLQIYIISLDGGEATQITSMVSGVHAVEWSPDGHRLLFLAKQEVDPSARGERSPPPDKRVPQVVWRLPYKADGIGYTLNHEIHLFTIDIENKTLAQLTDGPFDVRSAQFSPDGSRITFVRTRVGREAHRTDIWVMDADGKNARQVSENIAAVQNPCWSPDGKWIAFSGSEKEGDSRTMLFLIDMSNMAVRPLGDAEIEVGQGDSLKWGQSSDCLFFIIARRGLYEIATTDITSQKLKILVSSELHILKLALASKHLVYAAAGIAAPCEVFSAALDGSDEKRLSSFNGWWADRIMPRASIRLFEVPDGNGKTETIDGWLMTPPCRADMPMPLFVDVHGGPQSLALLEFSKTAWRHVLCSQGWAVLALNPVGSSSYGLEFMTRLRNKWGVLDLPQQMAAIRTLQQDGLVDDRLAIYGKSYGGYLSAWAITQTNAFKAAVVSAPVANIESHFGTSDSGYYVTPYAMCGEPYVDRAAAHSLSPLDHMHNARTPTLLLQGTNDQRCPAGQSEEIFATLIRSGDVATEMVLYPDADHHLAESGSPSFRVDYVSRLVEWVEKWCTKKEDGGLQTNPQKATRSSSG